MEPLKITNKERCEIQKEKIASLKFHRAFLAIIFAISCGYIVTDTIGDTKYEKMISQQKDAIGSLELKVTRLEIQLSKKTIEMQSLINSNLDYQLRLREIDPILRDSYLLFGRLIKIAFGEYPGPIWEEKGNIEKLRDQTGVILGIPEKAK